MELKAWTYEEFRDYRTEGVQRIPTTGDETAVRYINDVVYAEMDGTPLHLQILIPYSRNNPKRILPCVVYVQGSAWMKQDIHGDVPQLSKLAERGFVCALVEYRHSGIASFPAPVVDARNAVRFLRMHAEEYGIDSEKIIMSGNSSGGHTAVYAGMRHNDDTDENLYPGVSAEVKGIINYYGSTVFTIEDSNPMTSSHLQADSPEGREAGNVDLRERRDLLEAMSADLSIHDDTVIAPVLILHGTKDRVVNTECSTILWKRLKETGHDAEYYLIEGADHGKAEFWSAPVLDIVEEFIRRCI